MELIINIDTRKNEGKKLLEYLQTLPYVKVNYKDKKPNKTTIKAIEDAKNGKTEKFNTIDALMEDLND